MRLYGLKNCDTCRKALKSLPDAEFVDVRAQGVPAEILDQALMLFNDSLVNTRSTTWRSLDDSERTRSSAELLVDHPTLMKRPLIEKDGELFLGWTPQTRESLGVA